MLHRHRLTAPRGLLVLSLALAGCLAGEAPATGADPEKLRKGYHYCSLTRNLQILGAFGFLSEKKKESYLTEVLREVAREMGVTFRIDFLPWKRCELMVEKGHAWAAVPYVRTPEREEKFYFSDRLYAVAVKLFYYGLDLEKIQFDYCGPGDLKGYSVGGVIGSE